MMARQLPGTALMAVAALELDLEDATSQRDAARRQLAGRNNDCVRLAGRIRELEDRMYGDTARSITRWMEPSLSNYTYEDITVLRLQPKGCSIAIPSRSLLPSRNPIAVIHEGIEKIIEKHSEDLRQQMRALAWSSAARR